MQPQDLGTAQIMERGLHRLCPVCEETLEVFCEMLGTVAGNVALTLGAKGGIYIGGRIVPQMSEFFERSGFRARFEQKGRFSDYLSHIPTFYYCRFGGCELHVSFLNINYCMNYFTKNS